MNAIQDIVAERQRQQTKEGFDAHNDNLYTEKELAFAAAAYAASAGGEPDVAKNIWPWRFEWWKPTNPRRDLVKAGALIVAEIERLDRIAAAQTPDTYAYLFLMAQRKTWHHEVPEGWEEIAWERFNYVECGIYRKPLDQLTVADKDDWLPYHATRPAEWVEPSQRSEHPAGAMEGV